MCKVPKKIDSIDCGNTNKKKEIKSIDYIFEVYYVNLKQKESLINHLIKENKKKNPSKHTKKYSKNRL